MSVVTIMTSHHHEPPPEPTALPYRRCVGIMLFNDHGLVWVGRRADMPGEPEGPGEWWQMPQGGIDKGEDPAGAALRELYEETGVRSAEIIAESAQWYHYDLPDHLIGVAWKGRYRGQQQKWFAARFTGTDDEVDISGHDGMKAEFDRWHWAPIGDLVAAIVPFKRRVYEQVVGEFLHLAEG